MNDIKLAPCPFCGSWKRSLHRSRKNTKEQFQVICMECLSCGPVAYNEASAAEAWNHRRRK